MRHTGPRDSFEQVGNHRREGHVLHHAVGSDSGLEENSTRHDVRAGSGSGNRRVVDYSLEQGAHGDRNVHQGDHHSYLHGGVVSEIYTGREEPHPESVGELG